MGSDNRKTPLPVAIGTRYLLLLVPVLLLLIPVTCCYWYSLLVAIGTRYLLLLL